MKTIYLLPVFLYVFLLPNLVDGIEFPRSILIVIFALSFAMLRPRYLRVKSKIVLIPFTIPIFMAFSSIFNLQNPLSALFGKQGRNFGILLYASLSMIILIMSNFKITGSKNLLRYTIVPISVLSVLYGALQVFKKDFLVWGESDRVVLTLGNSNYAAGFISLLTSGLVYGILQSNRKSIKLTYSILLISLLYIGIRTISFQFYFLTIVSVVSFLFFANYHSIIRISKKILLFESFMILTTSVLLLNSFKSVLNELTSADDRLAMQKAGLEIFKDNFVFGVGVDGLNRFMPQYLTLEDLNRENGYFIPDKTHNSVIDHLANGGIFTAISYCAFITFIFFCISRILSDSYKDNLEIALPASIFCTYFIQGFMNTDSVLNMVIPYISIGMLVSIYLQSKRIEEAPKGIFWKNLNQIFIAIIILSLILLVPRAFQSEIETKRVLTSQSISSEKIIEAINFWPDRGNIEKILVAVAQNVKNCPIAITVADKLIEVDSRSGQGWYVKGLCADSLGDHEKALTYIVNAVNFQPLNPNYLRAKFQLEDFLKRDLEANETLEILNQIQFS